MTGKTAIPDEQGFLAYLGQHQLSESYLGDIMSTLRRIIRDTGSIPKDIVKFNEEYFAGRRISMHKKIIYRTAVRRYCEYRKARYGEDFNDG